MDNLLAKVEAWFEKKFQEFEANPVKTSLKFLVIYWVLKKIYTEIKKS